MFWLLLLRCLRDTGLPIADMVRFAELARAGDHTLGDRVDLLEEHDRRIEEQIAQLRTHQDYLRKKIDHYRAQQAAAALAR